MFCKIERDQTRYSPLYFLAALGAGGLVVTFFMWLMFWVPHPGRPVPIFEDIAGALTTSGILLKIAAVIAMIGIAFFSFTMMRLLIWSFRGLATWHVTPEFAAMRASNNETQLLAAPLASAMAVNVVFILGLVFVPGLWIVVEYLFPLALIAFLGIGCESRSKIGQQKRSYDLAVAE